VSLRSVVTRRTFRLLVNDVAELFRNVVAHDVFDTARLLVEALLNVKELDEETLYETVLTQDSLSRLLTFGVRVAPLYFSYSTSPASSRLESFSVTLGGETPRRSAILPVFAASPSRDSRYISFRYISVLSVVVASVILG